MQPTKKEGYANLYGPLAPITGLILIIVQGWLTSGVLMRQMTLDRPLESFSYTCSMHENFQRSLAFVALNLMFIPLVWKMTFNCQGLLFQHVLSWQCCQLANDSNAFQKSLWHLFEVIECREDDLVTSANETDGSQQLKDQRLCPANTRGTSSEHLQDNVQKQTSDER